MKYLVRTSYSEPAFSIGLFLLRVAGGVMMIPHGYNKLVNFQKYAVDFDDPFGIGHSLSLSLNIFAEFFCPIFVTAGFLTRFSTIPVMIAMGVALFVAHHGDLFGAGEKAALFLGIYTTILFTGPGRLSVDRMIVK